jgi:hypothetical protein
MRHEAMTSNVMIILLCIHEFGKLVISDFVTKFCS